MAPDKKMILTAKLASQARHEMGAPNGVVRSRETWSRKTRTLRKDAGWTVIVDEMDRMDGMMTGAARLEAAGSWVEDEETAGNGVPALPARSHFWRPDRAAKCA